MSKVPKVSLGLAVYNGENYLRKSIDSLLSQTFTDFELIISDNASTDTTPEICQEYLNKDPRVSYVRNNCNIGLAKNLNQTFNLSSGEYFKWAAHDDFISPDYLQNCVEVLDNNADVVLCQARAKKVDRNGQLLCKSEDLDNYSYPINIEAGLDSNKVYDRLRSLQKEPSGWLQVYGLIRRSALLNTALFGGYPEDDHVLLTQLALQGRIYTETQSTFFSREHGEQSISIVRRSMHQFAIWIRPDKRGQLFFPQWELTITYIKALISFPQANLSKVLMLLAAILFVANKLPRLLKDVCIGILQILDCTVRRLQGPFSTVNSDTLIFGRYPRIEL
jgi:glycosyltransferase involved in cell wall biosynthesis